MNVELTYWGMHPAPVSLDIRSCLKKAYPLVNVYSLRAMEHHHFIAG